MATNFTDEQLRAIETLDKSILVSAAAGSGKTTVLVNRIIGIILSGKANVDEMLVVTFTNAAASEMRLRLGAEIRKRIKSNPEDTTRLKEQLSRLYRAYISTIDSFALRIVREFFYETDIEPDFSICDEVQSEIMKREAISEVLEAAFENDELIEGGSFREFMRLYSDERSDETFMSNLIKSYDDLRTMPDYFEWAYRKAEALRVTPYTFEGSDVEEAVRKDVGNALNDASEAARRTREMLDNAGLADLYERKLAPEVNLINDMMSSAESGGSCIDIFDALKSIEFASMVTKKDEKEAFEPIKAEIKSLRDSYKDDIKGLILRYMTPDFETCLREMNETYPYMIYYLRLLEKFEAAYSKKKSQKRLMDFADISHAAVRVLKNEDAANTMRNRFKYIFVDEYQDTNNLQEYLIGKVSQKRNVFKVGDVKQSIYRFRLAEPEIFERLSREYDNRDYEDGELINLGMNFRTNDNTIRYINHVFEHIMENYNDETKLYTGVQCPEEYDFMPEVHVLLKDLDDEDEYGEAYDDAEGDIDELSNNEAESRYIADLAAGIIGTEFYDAKEGIVRKAEPRDIAILMRSVKFSGEQIASELAAKSVESHIEETDDYFDTMEINVALALFMCIDNLKRDIPLIATLHSEVFNFTPEELAGIRIAHKESCGGRRTAYYEAFEWYISDGPDGELKDKAISACKQLHDWRSLSRIIPLSDFVWKVLTDSGYYRAAGAMNSGARRQANLRALADKAAAFTKDNIASLSSFINFVEVMKSKKISNGQPPMAGKEDNLVRISTMHKSKGLEFPFVIVGGLGRKFNRDKRERKFTFDSSVGAGLPYIDPDRKYWRSSILQNAIKMKSDRDSYKEDLRLLYVDMTRARNKLYLVGAVKNEEEITKYGKPNNYLKVLRDHIKTPYNEYHIQNLPKIVKQEYAKNKLFPDEKTSLGEEAQSMYRELDRRFKYRYPYEEQLTAKSKYSVSAIRNEELAIEALPAHESADKEEAENAAARKEAEIVNLWDRSERRKKAGAADIGIAYHRIMEFIDFNKAADENGNVDEEYIKDRAYFLKEHGAIEEDAYAYVDLSKISDFFRSDIGRRAVRADKSGALQREKAFTLKTERLGREILVQGVIDCLFEEDGQMVLVDYKSSYIRQGASYDAEIERVKNEYKVQLELYSEAIEKGTDMEVREAYLYLFHNGEVIKI